MTPKKREKITEDVLREVRERCQQEQDRIRAEMERDYWVGDWETSWDDPSIARIIATGLIGMILLGLMMTGCSLLLTCGGGV